MRFGFKIWWLCKSKDDLYKFIPVGEKTSAYENDIELGANVVLELMSVVQQPSVHHIFSDNYFSSYKIFGLLKENGIYATGIKRENCTCNTTVKTVKIIEENDFGTKDCFIDRVPGA